MTPASPISPSLPALDQPTRQLVRLSAVVTAGGERDVRHALAGAADVVPDLWVEELLLQTFLFAGFPRALNAMRDWRRVRPERAAPGSDDAPAGWQGAGEQTCAVVYGKSYAKLRQNIRHLHPALDDWMITDGYGKVLSRPGLDLVRRELCIVAACAAAAQERQLHSHLLGALNAGASPALVSDTLDALDGVVASAHLETARMLWARVRGK